MTSASMNTEIDWTEFEKQPIPEVSNSTGLSVKVALNKDGTWTATSSDLKALEKFLRAVDKPKPQPTLVVPAGVQLHYLTEETETKRRNIVVAFIISKDGKSVTYQSCIHNNTRDAGKRYIKFNRNTHGYTALKRLQRRPIRLDIHPSDRPEDFVKLIREDMPRHPLVKPEPAPDCTSIFSN